MGLLANLWKLIGPTWPQGYCPQTFQEMSDFMINGTQVTFLIDTGNFLYNYGNATPPPENRIFPWLNTDDNLWWNFKFGVWVHPVCPRDLVDGFRQMYLPAAGTLESDVWKLDQGDGTDPSINGTVSDVNGAMWSVDHTMDGRFPLGAGTIPDSDLGSGLAQVGIAQTADSFGRSGEYAHLLTDTEGAVANHVHAIGLTNQTNATADFVINKIATTPTLSYPTRFVNGGNVVQVGTENQADLYTLRANDGAGVTGVKHQNMPPFKAVWFLRHTARKFYTRVA